MNKFVLGGASALALGAMVWLVMPPGSSARADSPYAGRDLALGAEIYQQTCAACHGANLEGAPDWQSRNPDGTMPAPPHDVTGHTWHHEDALLFDYVDLGGTEALARRGISGFVSGMPALGDSLSADEIWTVLAYIRSTWPEQARAFQEERTRASGG